MTEKETEFPEDDLPDEDGGQDASGSAAAGGEPEAFENDEDNQQGLFPSDTGLLPPMTRQVLVHLLKGPYFDRRTSTKLWDELKKNEETIRSRLSDIYLDLLIDDEIGVAFCRRPDLGEHDAPTLLTSSRLRFLDSAVLLDLRERLLHARADGVRAWITEADLADIMRLYDRTADTDIKSFASHISGVRKRMLERRILLELKSGDGYEISPILPLLFPTADIARLREAYIERLVAMAPDAEEAKKIRERFAPQDDLGELVAQAMADDAAADGASDDSSR